MRPQTHRIRGVILRNRWVDLSRHHGLHPYVVSAVVTNSGEDADGHWWDWRVVERPKLGPLRYTIRFPARMIRTSETSMAGKVRAAPGCTLLTSTKAELAKQS